MFPIVDINPEPHELDDPPENRLPIPLKILFPNDLIGSNIPPNGLVDDNPQELPENNPLMPLKSFPPHLLIESKTPPNIPLFEEDVSPSTPV